MEITISKNPEWDKKSLSDSTREFTREYWIEKFTELAQVVTDNGKVLGRCMSEEDSYYDTRLGAYELNNVKAGKASFEKTFKACSLLKSYLIKQQLLTD